MSNLHFKVIVIAGATATGKSDFAVRLAKVIDAEIINADIGSMYEPMSIGTAKPDWKNASIPHHLFDIFSEPVSFSFVKYRDLVQKTIASVHARGKHAIVVGGSTMYIKALFFQQKSIDQIAVDIKPELSGLNLWQSLAEIDPVRASAIHPHDHYRLHQALHIFHTTNQKPSDFQPIFAPISAEAYCINLVRDRVELYKRIDDRVLLMIEQGLQQEVINLVNAKPHWAHFLKDKKIIGYDDIILYIQHKSGMDVDFDQVVSTIQQKSRNYAKRQELFFKKLFVQLNQALQHNALVGVVDELNLTLCDVGLYIKGLSEKILHNSMKR